MFVVRRRRFIRLNIKEKRRTDGELGMQWQESIVLVTRVTCFTVIVTSPAWMFAVYFIFRV